MKLIIQIPAYNEEKTIGPTLAALPKKIEGIRSIETVVIDDGSSDATVDAARRGGARHVVRLLNHRGLSTAFLAGIDAALRLGADIIVNTDADNQYSSADIEKLVRPIMKGEAEVVVGDRDTRNSPYMGSGKKFLQRVGSWAVSIASGVRLPDVTSGFRAFSRDAAFQINVFNPFTYTLETIIQAGNRNLRVQSVVIGTNAPTRPSRLYRGIFSYVRKSATTIFRIYTTYKPLKTFFALGTFLVLGGLASSAPFFWDLARHGRGGHIQSLILAAVLLIAGFQTWLIGLVADLISVNRRLSEELLIRVRKMDFARAESRDRRRSGRRPERELPTEPLEDQWVWLIDETKLEERTGGTEVARDENAPGGGESRPRKRRRRRRTGPRRFSEPRPHHHEGESEDQE
ncbi:MAG: glycosyltransferase family 2 protein [Thermoanaerobaculia bacterium]